MSTSSANLKRPPFRPLAVGALYSGIERGLAADVLAARAFDGSAYTVSTSLVSAGQGRVTDVLEVPSDSVRAQLEHIFSTGAPTSARLGILGSHQSATAVFELLQSNFEGPVVLDVTLSGPSGEDVMGPRGLEAIQGGFSQVDLVTLRRLDAERIAGQEITKLGEAQVAAQRIAQRGAGKVLLRCGSLSSPESEVSPNGDIGNMNVDLYFDGDEFALYEAPHQAAEQVNGSSSALFMASLHYVHNGASWPQALQQAKAFSAEAIRSSVRNDVDVLDHFWRLRGQESTSADTSS